MSKTTTNTEESSDDSYFRISNASSVNSVVSDYGTKTKFRFPTPPRFSHSLTHSCNSDSSNSDYIRSSKRKNRSFAKKLPPLGIFWDIENCQVPRAKSASDIVQKIRGTFLENYRESEFIVVCDVKKENPQHIQDLHDSQVNLIHVSATSKNAADEKLRQSLRRFAELHPSPSGIVLISSDINFAADLADLRFRKKVRVILIHQVSVADALILCANEHHCFKQFTEDLPEPKERIPQVPVFLQVINLPINCTHKRLKSRLRLLIDNCGGRVSDIDENLGSATLKFSNLDAARRAQRRIQGEDVFGNKIKVISPTVRNYSGRKIKNGTSSNFQSYPMAPPGFTTQEYAQNFSYNQTGSRKDDLGGQSHDVYMFRPIRGMGSVTTPMECSYEQQFGNNGGGWSNGQRRNGDRNSRTPQDGASALPPARAHTISGSSDYSDDGKTFYQASDGAKSNNPSINQPVDLIISNLDPTIDTKELRRLLTNMLKEYAMILSLSIVVQADGTPIANIRVNSQQEAQFAISQLHRQKLGHKRIVISYAQNNSPDPEQLRAMVIGLLQEVPDQCMPLFKFIELLESRYHCTVSVSEVNKLKDICKITDDLGSRIISLTNEIKASPPPNLSRTYLPYCTIHCPNGLQSGGWCELSTVQSPNVMMTLKTFCSKLQALLNLHLGSLPLLSFQSCYEQEFHEPLPVDENGVPLEHMISCVQNVEITCVGPNKNIKVVKQELKIIDSDEEAILKTVPPSLAPNISLLCRELVDLLKTTEKCQLLLSKFIPAYHHHFGRQCRVADYGYTKLLDLFESISHVVQIMGDGTRRVITLSHTAQVRRFTSDLLRVLKVQPAKQILLGDFPAAYEKVMSKPFSAVEYGLCTFQDLLQEVPDNTVALSKIEDGVYIAVPKREQTADEVVRTKQFANEVIDLLRHAPYYTMLFNKFVPAYHHHFGHQCKVSDYGFTKLIELFEAIPDIVKIEELSDGERTVSLALDQSLMILGAQLVQLVRATKTNSLPLEQLATVYLRECGYPLKPQIYECETLEEVVEKLPDHVQMIRSNAGTLLTAIEMDTLPMLKVRSWALLLTPPHCKDLPTFKYEYQSRYNSSFSVNNLQQLGNVVSLSSGNDTNYIALTALYVLAAQLYHVLYQNGGSVLFAQLEQLYQDAYGKPLRLAHYNINSTDEFYAHFAALFFVRGSKKKSVVVLNRNLAEHLVPLPPSMYDSSHFAKRDNVQWPPPPPRELVQNAVKKVSPPKPDTPPTPGAAPWNHWTNTSTFDNSLNLSIQMPIVHNPKLLGNPDSLISPARHLLATGRNPWSALPSIAAPHPAELPMPDKFISKGVMSDDSTDSGCNTKLDNSPYDNDIDSSCERYIGGKPHFATYLNFNN